jgi:hypothetical protein
MIQQPAGRIIPGAPYKQKVIVSVTKEIGDSKKAMKSG